MAKGYPDYATPYGEVLAPLGFMDFFSQLQGSAVGGSYVDILEGVVPAGYNLDISLHVLSANGCEAYHLDAFYKNGVLIKAYYFEVNLVLVSPRYLSFVAGDAYSARLYNYGDSERAFNCYCRGILLVKGTEPLHPQPDPGEPPKLEPDETLFLVDNPWEGKVWRKVKNIPIPKEGWERHHPPLYLPREVE